MPKSERKPPEEFSKTKVKNEMLALQDMGKALVDLPKKQLVELDLPDILLEALLLAQTITANEGKRRQLQFIGKIMREVDVESIKLALIKIKSKKKAEVQEFHHIEKWRDDLITEGDTALQKFIELHPEVDKQKIRQLVRKAQEDKAKSKDTGGSTGLFKYLREILEDQA